MVLGSHHKKRGEKEWHVKYIMDRMADDSKWFVRKAAEQKENIYKIEGEKSDYEVKKTDNQRKTCVH
jgi:hypothetical protein